MWYTYIHTYTDTHTQMRLPTAVSAKESTCQCRRHKRLRFNAWVRKIPWRRKWHSTSVFLPGKFHDSGTLQAIVYGVSKSQKWLSNWVHMHAYWYEISRKGKSIEIKSSLGIAWMDLGGGTSTNWKSSFLEWWKYPILTFYYNIEVDS